jgi:hypothetical protein
MRDRYEGIESAHKNTFKWIFNQSSDWNKPWDDFARWLKAGDGIYWVSGKAGSGKSTLMRYIIDDPLTKMFLQNWAKDSLSAHNCKFLLLGKWNTRSIIAIWAFLEVFCSLFSLRGVIL